MLMLRKAPNLRCYEYIAVYADDLCKATESLSTIFKTKYPLKVKGDGKLSYDLCADYFADLWSTDNVMFWDVGD